jgi:hypothetical protein
MKVSDRIEQTVVGLLGLCALVIGLWRHSAIPDSAASIVLGIITYVPFLTLWLPNLVFG